MTFNPRLYFPFPNAFFVLTFTTWNAAPQESKAKYGTEIATLGPSSRGVGSSLLLFRRAVAFECALVLPQSQRERISFKPNVGRSLHFANTVLVARRRPSTADEER